MCGGFAAGHVPLASLHTMARLCKEGGFLINSMTKEYADFVEEYNNIDQYVEELQEDGTWTVEFRRILKNYTKGNNGLVHAMRVNPKETPEKRGEEEGTQVWKELVYNKNITKEKVIESYSSWATGYDEDFNKIHPNRAKHMADFLLEMLEEAGMQKEKVKILDVAAGTGLVGEELKKAGFTVDNVTALDLCPEMLEVAKQKKIYGKLVKAPFGTTIPKGLKARSYDCVIMCGGFAAGHIPLASLHTMARLCKKGGFVINSMTKQYSEFVEEYKNIDRYMEELHEEGTWKLMYRRILDQYTKGNQGLVHGMKVL
jgi:ubiquinone/menaquinone biosynthesis C-methylase UbiE